MRQARCSWLRQAFLSLLLIGSQMVLGQVAIAATGSWQQLLPESSGPPARHLATAVFDSVTDQVVLFGGAHDGTLPFDDTWVLRLSGPGAPVWRRLITQGTSPSARFAHTAIW